ncbi:MAG: uracil-DNA glycosylase [Clostridia bacterium]|jgi:uracil-DNA glycosylase|nr:uracil-DNA glycosylase [Clostridia bacterium]MDD4275595.1 uracil-DNA glycosylase [Clostridia bacterium]
MFTITKNWYEILKPEFDKPYYKCLADFLQQEYYSQTIYPKPEQVFNALNYVKYANVKVVIIGQDPYHGLNQAHGLCFSVQKGVDIPPSLQNIYKELKSDLNCIVPKHGNLEKWAKQGVLMLNSVLTVRSGQANSHRLKGWENFTSAIMNVLNQRVEPIIFMLWGANAKEIGKNIDTSKHFVLYAPHPSPLSAYNGFFGCKHFSKANEILKNLNKEPIDWQID